MSAAVEDIKDYIENSEQKHFNTIAFNFEDDLFELFRYQTSAGWPSLAPKLQFENTRIFRAKAGLTNRNFDVKKIASNRNYQASDLQCIN